MSPSVAGWLARFELALEPPLELSFGLDSELAPRMSEA